MSDVHYLPTRVVDASMLGRHKAPMLRHRLPRPAVQPVWSHVANWAQLVELWEVPPRLDLPRGWGRRWKVDYKHDDNVLTESVSNVALRDLLTADPMLKNSWHRGKTARAGVRHISSTNLRNAHASKFERDTLIVCDFLGATAIASQPFAFSYELAGETRHHTPDFLALIDGIPKVINCRPRPSVSSALIEDVAALGAFCVSRGWSNALVVGYPQPARATLDALSAHGTADDIFGFTEDVLDQLDSHGPTSFEALASSFQAVPVARGIIQMLLWATDLSIDLAVPLEDDSLVYLPNQVEGVLA